MLLCKYNLALKVVAKLSKLRMFDTNLHLSLNPCKHLLELVSFQTNLQIRLNNCADCWRQPLDLYNHVYTTYYRYLNTYFCVIFAHIHIERLIFRYFVSNIVAEQFMSIWGLTWKKTLAKVANHKRTSHEIEHSLDTMKCLLRKPPHPKSRDTGPQAVRNFRQRERFPNMFINTCIVHVLLWILFCWFLWGFNMGSLRPILLDNMVSSFKNTTGNKRMQRPKGTEELSHSWLLMGYFLCIFRWPLALWRPWVPQNCPHKPVISLVVLMSCFNKWSLVCRVVERLTPLLADGVPLYFSWA